MTRILDTRMTSTYTRIMQQNQSLIASYTELRNAMQNTLNVTGASRTGTSGRGNVGTAGNADSEAAEINALYAHQSRLLSEIFGYDQKIQRIQASGAQDQARKLAALEQQRSVAEAIYNTNDNILRSIYNQNDEHVRMNALVLRQEEYYRKLAALHEGVANDTTNRQSAEGRQSLYAQQARLLTEIYG